MNRKSKKKRVVVLVTVGALVPVALLLAASGAWAGPDARGLVGPLAPAAVVSNTLTYQGRLLDAGGEPVDGSRTVTFRLYADPSGGTPLWTQTGSVWVDDGLLNAHLDVNPALFDGQALWLGVQVAGDAQEMVPRQLLLPAPYAFHALSAPWSGLTGVPPGLNDGDDDTLGGLSCANGQIAEWNGSSWQCGADDVGGGAAAWLLAGNSGTNPATHFLGTTDGVSLTLVVNSASALRLEPNGTSPNLVGGYGGNSVAPGVVGATIGGGGWSSYPNQVTWDYGTVGGGAGNTTGYSGATVGGGLANTASGYGATVGGGEYNEAGDYATVGGGFDNEASGNSATVSGGYRNEASGVYYATVGGGFLNEASGDSATVGGGTQNVVTGTYATIGGGGYISVMGEAATVAGGSWITATGDYAAVGGGAHNVVTATYATVGGGVSNNAMGGKSTIGGGEDNHTYAAFATVGGGALNEASGNSSTIGGGHQNVVTATEGTVGGGYQNVVTNTYGTVGGGRWNMAWGYVATVGGGTNNIASGMDATVPGGRYNTASGNYSFAAGHRAKASHNGAFVWGDSTDADVTSPAVDSFIVRASGGVTMYTSSNLSNGATLPAGGGGWSTFSDRNAKENFAAADGQEVLALLAEVPIFTWNYKTQDPSIRHMGPIAQDFHAAFGLGEDSRRISTIDADGVALAAIQGLYAQNQELAAENAALQQQVDDLEARLAALEAGGGTSQASGLQFSGGWWALGGLVIVASVVGRRRYLGGGR
jgi:hypothetical protein